MPDRSHHRAIAFQRAPYSKAMADGATARFDAWRRCVGCRQLVGWLDVGKLWPQLDCTLCLETYSMIYAAHVAFSSTSTHKVTFGPHTSFVCEYPRDTADAVRVQRFVDTVNRSCRACVARMMRVHFPTAVRRMKRRPPRPAHSRHSRHHTLVLAPPPPFSLNF